MAYERYLCGAPKGWEPKRREFGSEVEYRLACLGFWKRMCPKHGQDVETCHVAGLRLLEARGR